MHTIPGKVTICITVILTLLLSCSKKTAPTAEPAFQTYAWTQFVMGADLSFANALDDHGAIFRDSGKAGDVFRIMHDHGANLVRVRLWHTPSWQQSLFGGKYYSDLADVEKTIQRAKTLGMAVNLDLHYSDDWADPQKQETPAAWTMLSLATLKDSVHDYTLRVLNELSSKGLTPEMIQVGNETNSGMCWPVGKVNGSDYSGFATLLKAGISAVREFSATSAIKPRIILHEAQLQTADEWTRNILNAGVTDFDVLGLSHYYKWSTVNSMDSVGATIRRLKNLTGKDVMIVETAFSFTDANADSYGNIMSATGAAAGYPISKQGQMDYMKALAQTVISSGGTGIMYWEPEWITSSMKDRWGTGSSWENNTLFDFSGNTLPGMDWMRLSYVF